MKTKHTPGPWDLIDSKYVDKLVSLGEFDDDNYNVLQIEHGERIPQHERESNAILIAAAPELLEALEAIDTETIFRDSHSEYFTLNVDVASKIRFAIAKAKGGIK